MSSVSSARAGQLAEQRLDETQRLDREPMRPAERHVHRKRQRLPAAIGGGRIDVLLAVELGLAEVDLAVRAGVAVAPTPGAVADAACAELDPRGGGEDGFEIGERQRRVAGGGIEEQGLHSGQRRRAGRYEANSARRLSCGRWVRTSSALIHSAATCSWLSCTALVAVSAGK